MSGNGRWLVIDRPVDPQDPGGEQEYALASTCKYCDENEAEHCPTCDGCYSPSLAQCECVEP